MYRHPILDLLSPICTQQVQIFSRGANCRWHCGRLLVFPARSEFFQLILLQRRTLSKNASFYGLPVEMYRLKSDFLCTSFTQGHTDIVLLDIQLQRLQNLHRCPKPSCCEVDIISDGDEVTAGTNILSHQIVALDQRQRHHRPVNTNTSCDADLRAPQPRLYVDHTLMSVESASSDSPSRELAECQENAECITGLTGDYVCAQFT
ncbi:uncharacterized protein LOC124286258 [Haliotis rubra]|uniref:uncharacterized protein LOC124286258 n=1 Tax=Haliotis rubra TaxID=36100 RepID=UPI001EE5711B|nr:uncharacterized protein LOC124286258 [Haliotis rubra]